jgi:hypothetical protein
MFIPVSIIDKYLGFDLRRIEFIKRSNSDGSVIESIAFAVLNLITPHVKIKKARYLFFQKYNYLVIISNMLLDISMMINLVILLVYSVKLSGSEYSKKSLRV